MEEVLTGETNETLQAVTERTRHLIHALGHSAVANSTASLSVDELVNCIFRALDLPEIATVRSELLTEFPVYALRTDGNEEIVIAGIADALTIGHDGIPVIVVDWKSDVNPDPQTLEHYRSQVRTYLDMTGSRFDAA